mmetsp:Transcript_22562/g.31576  ORF Transcript_22562/g.31576 Transcript_22562/m.31576 type:complete len:82 (+) Transcript_22562:148-393(+)
MIQMKNTLILYKKLTNYARLTDDERPDANIGSRKLHKGNKSTLISVAEIPIFVVHRRKSSEIRSWNRDELGLPFLASHQDR